MENGFNYNEHAQADFFSGVLYYFYKHDKERYQKFSDAQWEQIVPTLTDEGKHPANREK